MGMKMKMKREMKMKMKMKREMKMKMKMKRGPGRLTSGSRGYRY